MTLEQAGTELILAAARVDELIKVMEGEVDLE